MSRLDIFAPLQMAHSLPNSVVRLAVSRDGVECEKTELSPDISLDDLTVARFLFGPTSPELPMDCEKTSLLRAWLPLPLSWNELDRI